ncbi:MAG TPA: hypothetical protein VGB55_05860 [Tepidisphaeraceae bacterium]|jgi:hypothetical protein
MSSTFAYYFSPDGKHIEGPLSLGDIRRRLGEGATRRAQSQALIVSQGMRDWIHADCMPGLFPVVERLGWRPPPLPGAKGEAAHDHGQKHASDPAHATDAVVAPPPVTSEAVAPSEATPPKDVAAAAPAPTPPVVAPVLDAVTIDDEGDDIVDAPVLEFESDAVELDKADLDEFTIDLEDEEPAFSNGRDS